MAATHTKASVFAEPFMWKFRANRKQWDIAIANHAGLGQLPRSLLSPLETRRRAGYCGCGTCCHVPKDQIQSTAILQEMRWRQELATAYVALSGQSDPRLSAYGAKWTVMLRCCDVCE